MADVPMAAIAQETGMSRGTLARRPRHALDEALLFGSLWLVLYAGCAWLATASFVRWYEEPTPGLGRRR